LLFAGKFLGVPQKTRRNFDTLWRIGALSGVKWGRVAQTKGFVGEYLHSVDQKGRVALPAKFREALGSRFIVARGLDKCLYVYPEDEWEKVLEKVGSMPLNQRDSRAFARYFLSGASEGEPDRQGRVVLPPNLRQYAGLTKDVYFLGVGTRVEIWDKDTWDRIKVEMEESFTNLAESVAKI